MELINLHEDNRGSIYITIGKEFKKYDEVTMFFTRAGYSRGGCIHNKNREFCTIIEGKIDYIIGNEKRRMGAGETTLIPRGTPHYFISITDSIVLEWGATPEEKKVKHPEFRAEVERLNNELEVGLTG